jgi:hypothetical protein
MVRTVKGITLTPEERRKAGYDRQNTQAHICSVTLPNGVSCEVSYTRTSARVHSFAFGHPIKRTDYVYAAIPGGIPGIEEKAAALANAMFQQAQKQEQQTMRQKAPAHRTLPFKDDGPQISARLAEQLAGLYAPCVKCSSGTLIRVGGTYSAPEGALKEIQAGRHRAIRLINGQQFVVGICNRAAQRWEEPMFLSVPCPNGDAGTSGVNTPADAKEDLEDDDSESTNAVRNQEGDPITEEEAYHG